MRTHWRFTPRAEGPESSSRSGRSLGAPIALGQFQIVVGKSERFHRKRSRLNPLVTLPLDGVRNGNADVVRGVEELDALRVDVAGQGVGSASGTEGLGRSQQLGVIGETGQLRSGALLREVRPVAVRDQLDLPPL